MSFSDACSLTFTDSAAVKGKEGQFVLLTVDLPAVLDSWRGSLFAHEWLGPDGTLRDLQTMTEGVRAKYVHVLSLLERGEPLPRPVLGLGLFDTVEIGAGKEVLLALASRGVRSLPVHVPKSHESDFSAFLFHG